MKTIFLFLVLSIFSSNSFIIPDELPSLLSLVYSNLPVLKKGTDSRLGWGFRLGNRADFQVLVELGPQTNTQPLGNQPDNDSTNRKRNSPNNFANQLWAQQQHLKKVAKPEETKNVITDSDGGKWLQQWSNNMKNNPEPEVTTEKQIVPKGAKPGLAIGEIDAKSVIPDDSFAEELQKKSAEKRVIKESDNAKVNDTNNK